MSLLFPNKSFLRRKGSPTNPAVARIAEPPASNETEAVSAKVPVPGVNSMSPPAPLAVQLPKSPSSPAGTGRFTAGTASLRITTKMQEKAPSHRRSLFVPFSILNCLQPCALYSRYLRHFALRMILRSRCNNPSSSSSSSSCQK